jgi:O-acetyl-ADP-ribose deacetylase
VKHQCRTVAFPAISCGAYGYPVEDTAKIAIEAVFRFLSSDVTLSKVIFVLFTPHHVDIYKQHLKSP